MKKSLLIIMLVVSSFSLFACSNASRVASHNISRAADQFEIHRRVVFYNGITGDYMLSIEGRLSILPDKSNDQIHVLCKTGPGQYKRHTLGLSDNVTYFSEQLHTASVSSYRYRVIFRPTTIIPAPEMDLN